MINVANAPRFLQITLKILLRAVKLYKRFTYKLIFRQVSNTKEARLAEQLNRFDELLKDPPSDLGSKVLRWDEEKRGAGMTSQHFLIFELLAEEANFRRILEIGTFDANFTRFMSDRCLNAEIDTYDLPESSEEFTGTYNRNTDLDTFLERRAHNLTNCPNVKFFNTSSTCLLSSHEKYDFIWIDGAHGFPTIVSDLVNSVRLSNKDGYIAVDDVFFSAVEEDPYYISNAAAKTLDVLVNDGLIDQPILFHKRIDPYLDDVLNGKKYIAVFRRC